MGLVDDTALGEARVLELNLQVLRAVRRASISAGDRQSAAGAAPQRFGAAARENSRHAPAALGAR